MDRSILIAHPSAELYGSDRVMLETLDALRERGRRVVVTLPAPGPLVEEIERRGGRVQLCPAPVLRKSALRPAGLIRLGWATLRSIPPALRIIRDERPELIYVSTLTIPSWLLLGRLTRRRVACHVHESERTANRWVRKALAAPLFAAHRVVVNSQFSLGVLTESWPRLARRSEVVYNGVSGPAQLTTARAELAPAVRLLFVGRLSPRKGPQVAVAAVAELQGRGVPARLDVVGAVFPGYEWFETALREQVTAARLDDYVTLHGFTDDVWPFLADADLVLVPSQGDEPFGNTAVEAGLAARPVVVSANSGLDEAVAGFGAAQRVSADDLAGWTDAIQNVVDAWPAYRDKALCDRQHAVATYAPSVYRRRIAEELGVTERTGER